MKKYIPNTITCLNLLSGCIACVMAFEGSFFWAFVWIMLASVFDFLDGLAARLLKAYSPLGKELDSLADMVSFGVAPGFIVFHALNPLVDSLPLSQYIPYPYIAFLIPVFSALRLAKFNIDDRQTSSFIGLPTPANAMFWSSAVVGTYYSYPAEYALIYSVVTIVLVVGLSLLMVSDLPMFSLKVKNLSWKDNQIRYILVLVSILSLIFLGWAGIAVTIIFYILFSFIASIR